METKSLKFYIAPLLIVGSYVLGIKTSEFNFDNENSISDTSCSLIDRKYVLTLEGQDISFAEASSPIKENYLSIKEGVMFRNGHSYGKVQNLSLNIFTAGGTFMMEVLNGDSFNAIGVLLELGGVSIERYKCNPPPSKKM